MGAALKVLANRYLRYNAKVEDTLWAFIMLDVKLLRLIIPDSSNQMNSMAGSGRRNI